MKLEEKDIRVGNLLKPLSLGELEHVAKVTCIITDTIGIELIDENYEEYLSTRNDVDIKNLRGIELTEDWLVRCGFVYKEQVIENQYEKFDRYIWHNPNRSKPNYEVHFIESCYGGQFHKEIVYSFDIEERQRVFQTDYVHNLQNHFQISMGEELTIKTE